LAKQEVVAVWQMLWVWAAVLEQVSASLGVLCTVQINFLPVFLLAPAKNREWFYADIYCAVSISDMGFRKRNFELSAMQGLGDSALV